MSSAEHVATETFVDLQFTLQGHAVPPDYADALWSAVREILPWLEIDALAGIHPLSGLSPSAGGWYLSRRSHLTLRIEREQAAAAQPLVGARLQLGEHVLEVGTPHVRELARAPVLQAKFVVFGPASHDVTMSEEAFRGACVEELSALGVPPRLLCGKPQRASTPDGMLTGFSLVLLDLKADAALRLQRHGLGGERKRGCGIFIPHKSMAAVGTLE
jgi:CRISPR-associated protein Cas6